MPEPTLAQYFGNTAAQTAQEITIFKPDLESVGLDVQEENTAEAVLVALIKYWLLKVNDTTQTANPDQQLSFSLQSVNFTTNTAGTQVKRHTVVVEIDSIPTQAELELNPSKY